MERDSHGRFTTNAQMISPQVRVLSVFRNIKIRLPAALLKRNVLIAVVLLIATTIASGYFYQKYRSSQQELASLKSNQQVATDNKLLIEAVAKITELPDDEEPTIATVTDMDRLKSQSFFTRAENGDKVLIYPKTKIAVLYRPTTNKIVQISPVNIGAKEDVVLPTTTNK